MRRAEEATAKQKAQANGPSFVEAQDKKFAEQVAAGLTPQLSSKRSCESGCGCLGFLLCVWVCVRNGQASRS